MKFEDVENARKALNKKQAKVKKKAFMIAAIIEVVVVFLFITLNFDSFKNIVTKISFDKTPIIYILPLLFAVVFLILILMPIMVVAIAISLSTTKERLQYKKAYKGYFVGQSLAKTFTNTKYDHDIGLDKQVLIDTAMINTGDKYSSNDLTIGKYKDVDFTQADVHIEERHEDSDGDTYYVTIFKGRYMVFEFPKKFNSRMMLSHYHEPTKTTNPKTGKVMKRIETESVDFNKCYLTYAEDGVEAFYILTPDFMERAQELGRSHGDKVSFYFVDNKMIIGINDGNDIFEPPSPKEPIDEKAEIVKVNKEINLVINIIDNLKLDRKTSI